MFFGVPWDDLCLVSRSLFCSGSCPFSPQKTRFFWKIRGSEVRSVDSLRRCINASASGIWWYHRVHWSGSSSPGNYQSQYSTAVVPEVCVHGSARKSRGLSAIRADCRRGQKTRKKTTNPAWLDSDLWTDKGFMNGQRESNWRNQRTPLRPKHITTELWLFWYQIQFLNNHSSVVICIECSGVLLYLLLRRSDSLRPFNTHRSTPPVLSSPFPGDRARGKWMGLPMILSAPDSPHWPVRTACQRLLVCSRSEQASPGNVGNCEFGWFGRFRGILGEKMDDDPKK